MELDRRSLEKLLSLDNESFSELAKTIAEAAGADKSKAEAMANNPELLKRRLSRVTAEEAQQLIDSAGREKSEQITKMLRERGIDLGG